MLVQAVKGLSLYNNVLLEIRNYLNDGIAKNIVIIYWDNNDNEGEINTQVTNVKYIGLSFRKLFVKNTDDGLALHLAKFDQSGVDKLIDQDFGFLFASGKGVIPDPLKLNSLMFDKTNQDVVLQRSSQGQLLIKNPVGQIAAIVFQGDAATSLFQGGSREIATNTYYSSQRDGASIRYRAMNGSTSVQYWSLETDAAGNFVIRTNQTGKIQRLNIATPIVLSGASLPTSPWQNTYGGVIIAFMQFNLNPSTSGTSIAISISPDNVTYYNVVNISLPSGIGATTLTIPILLYNNWYVNWTLTNATLNQITVVFL